MIPKYRIEKIPFYAEFSLKIRNDENLIGLHRERRGEMSIPPNGKP